MRCVACNELLSEYESTKRALTSGDFLDLCNECIADTVPEDAVIDRDDLKSECDWVLTDDENLLKSL